MVNPTIDLGQIIVASAIVGGGVASWIAFRVTVVNRLGRMERDMRDAFGPRGRVARIEGHMIDQAGDLQRMIGQLDILKERRAEPRESRPR